MGLTSSRSGVVSLHHISTGKNLKTGPHIFRSADGCLTPSQAGSRCVCVCPRNLSITEDRTVFVQGMDDAQNW